jgi:hypothetical protein
VVRKLPNGPAAAPAGDMGPELSSSQQQLQQSSSAQQQQQ